MLIVEYDIDSTTYHIGIGLKEVLMQRNLLKREKSKIEEKERIKIIEPINVKLCFIDFTIDLNKFPEGYGCKTWNQSCTDLISGLSIDIGESIVILLVKSKVMKPYYKELLLSDICAEWVV